jgi:hypothetical protein
MDNNIHFRLGQKKTVKKGLTSKKDIGLQYSWQSWPPAWSGPEAGEEATGTAVTLAGGK